MDETTNRRRRTTVSAVTAAVVALVLLGGLRALVAPYTIPSDSMEPALAVGDLVLAVRPGSHDVQRGDIVVFDGHGLFTRDAAEPTYFVKRAIGIGGDRVACAGDGAPVTVNGEPIEEPYLSHGEAPSREAFDVAVPEGHLFLLGDHRSASEDSRSHLGSPGGGMVPVDRVTGRVERIIWPLSRAGSIERRPAEQRADALFSPFASGLADSSPAVSGAGASSAGASSLAVSSPAPRPETLPDARALASVHLPYQEDPA